MELNKSNCIKGVCFLKAKMFLSFGLCEKLFQMEKVGVTSCDREKERERERERESKGILVLAKTSCT